MAPWGALTPQQWSLELAVLAGGEPVGIQGIGATDFAVTREVHTGSWLGRRHHGRGIGTEMRAAVLHLAFAGLGADWAVSSALDGNHASIGVSRKLGYAEDGIAVQTVRGQRRIDQRFRIDRETWAARRTVPVRIEGLEPCRELLGAVSPAAAAPLPGAGAPPGRCVGDQQQQQRPGADPGTAIDSTRLTTRIATVVSGIGVVTPVGPTSGRRRAEFPVPAAPPGHAGRLSAETSSSRCRAAWLRGRTACC